eukprot:10318090-Ditylum_brightwellii.AAC.1
MAQEEELIVGMDANNKDKISSDFRKFYTSNNLVECSESCIDYIFTTPALIPAVKYMDFMPFNVPFVSNHSAICVQAPPPGPHL